MKKHIENLIASKGNVTKSNNKSESIKNYFDSKTKTNKSIFGLKR